MGGSEILNLCKLLTQVRVGRSGNDRLIYLNLFSQVTQSDQKIIDYYQDQFFNELWQGQEIELESFEDSVRQINVNLSANPGPSYKKMGFKNKCQAFPMMLLNARRFWERTQQGQTDNLTTLVGLAGRPKLRKFKSTRQRSEVQSLGRGVWMFDGHEQLISAPFTVSLNHFLSEYDQNIKLKFSKFQDSQQLLMNSYNFNSFYEVDFEEYDQSISQSLIKFAFSGICRLLKINDYEMKVLRYLEEQFIYTKIVLPNGKVYQKSQGVPSGSAFTSIINTIISNFVGWLTIQIATQKGLCSQGQQFSTGDNLIVQLQSLNPYEDKNKVLDIMEWVSDQLGLKIAKSKTRVTYQHHVKCGQFQDQQLSRDHSSLGITLLKRIHIMNGGDVNDFHKQIVEPRGPALGNTHRWYYIFQRAFSYLSYYLTEDGKQIRPTAEVLERLLNPENEVKDLEQYESSLDCALVENFYNLHTRNRIMHYYYDLLQMKKYRINTPERAEKDSFLQLLGKRSTRVFYRDVNYLIDMEKDPRLKEFKQLWKSKVKTVKMIYEKSDFMFRDWYLIRKVMKRGYDRAKLENLFSKSKLVYKDLQKNTFWNMVQLRNEMDGVKAQIEFDEIRDIVFQQSGMILDIYTRDSLVDYILKYDTELLYDKYR